MRARGLIAAASLALLAVPGPASATHGVGHPDWSCCAAVRQFPADFPVLLDDEWGYPIGGWGGIARDEPITRTPVIFVHGNSEDATFFDLQNESGLAVNVRQRFRDAGYTDQELWALSYNGARCGNNTCQTSNDVNVPDLERSIRAVLDYTGASRFDVVAHSLGVTLVRKTLLEHADLRARLEDAVYASGANEGTTVCRGSENVIGCHEIHPGSPWLAALNDGPQPDARIVTTCDCTGAADHFFLGPDARSPQLPGATNLEFPGSAHFVTARGPEVVPVYIPLIARGTKLRAGPVAPGVRVKDARAARGALPGTGVGTSAGAVLMLVIAVLGARGLRRRSA